jgi:hypothetical protein
MVSSGLLRLVALVRTDVSEESISLCRAIGLGDVEDPIYLDNWLTYGGQVVSLTHWPRSYPQKYFFYFSPSY